MTIDMIQGLIVIIPVLTIPGLYTFHAWRSYLRLAAEDAADRAERDACSREIDRRRRLFANLASDGKAWWWVNRVEGGPP